MKKIAFLLTCAFAFTVSAMAQKGVIESALKVANNDKSTVEQLKAAAETLMPIIANGTADGETYFAAGKVAYKLYDAYTKLNLLGKQADAKDMSTALLDGYNYMSAALKLDTVPETNKDGTVKIDKKTGAPKFKTKNSKDIVSTLQGYMQNYWDQGA
ncbi:MAG: hypothetical protein IK092_02865, partial [Muribaculaceae bacterium]|nr:hypothetical protein [Muribaculaceae bacterium]